MTTLLDVRGVSAGSAGEAVIHGISFDVAEGEAITIIGSNGAGKSTLFRAIVSMLRATTGTVTFDDQDTTNVPTHKISRLGLAYVPAERHLFPQMTVHENLSDHLLWQLLMLSPTDIDNQAADLLFDIGG